MSAEPDQTSVDDVEVVDVPERGRYEARSAGEVLGFLAYREREGRRLLVHTEVDPAHEGRGIGGRLAAFALSDARARGARVRVECPFVTTWLRRHPEFDAVVEARPGA